MSTTHVWITRDRVKAVRGLFKFCVNFFISFCADFLETSQDGFHLEITSQPFCSGFLARDFQSDASICWNDRANRRDRVRVLLDIGNPLSDFLIGQHVSVPASLAIINAECVPGEQAFEPGVFL